jgi:hypothetical protein
MILADSLLGSQTKFPESAGNRKSGKQKQCSVLTSSGGRGCEFLEPGKLANFHYPGVVKNQNSKISIAFIQISGFRGLGNI